MPAVSNKWSNEAKPKLDHIVCPVGISTALQELLKKPVVRKPTGFFFGTNFASTATHR
jgi:hypothetical protein